MSLAVSFTIQFCDFDHYQYMVYLVIALLVLDLLDYFIYDKVLHILQTPVCSVVLATYFF